MIGIFFALLPIILALVYAFYTQEKKISFEIIDGSLFVSYDGLIENRLQQNRGSLVGKITHLVCLPKIVPLVQDESGFCHFFDLRKREFVPVSKEMTPLGAIGNKIILSDLSEKPWIYERGYYYPAALESSRLKFLSYTYAISRPHHGDILMVKIKSASVTEGCLVNLTKGRIYTNRISKEACEEKLLELVVNFETSFSAESPGLGSIKVSRKKCESKKISIPNILLGKNKKRRIDNSLSLSLKKCV